MSDPYATFRPHRGAWVARISAVSCVVVFSVLALPVPVLGVGGASMSVPDRVLVVLFGLAGAAVLWRFAALRAVPSQAGLRVVNLVQTRELAWGEVVQASFSDGMPWLVLELTDTEQVSVMAIQRADGTRAKAEAGRMAALVAHHARPH